MTARCGGGGRERSGRCELTRMNRRRRRVLLGWSVVVAMSCCLLAGYGTREVVGSSILGRYPCSDPTRFFNPSGLECRACDVGEVVSADGLDCLCAPGSIESYAETTTPGLYSQGCLACQLSGLAPAADGSRCLPCGSNAVGSPYVNSTLDLVTGGCTCPPGHATVEVDGAGLELDAIMCLSCPNTTSWVDPSTPNICSECDYPKLYNGATCVCPTNSTLPAGTRCIDEAVVLSDIATQYGIALAGAASITFYNVAGSITAGILTVPSSTLIGKYFDNAAVGCYTDRDSDACNALANICVLQLYDMSTPACLLYSKLQEGITEYYHSEVSPPLPWPVGMPWLYYGNLAESWTQRKDVNLRVSFGSGSATQVSNLQFVLSSYAMDGSWLGYSNFTTQFQICGGSLDDRYEWTRVGTNYENECEVTLSTIVSEATTAEPIFYDVYLVDAAGRLYPVPVLITNIREGGLTVNQDGSDINDVLVRRFFFVDKYSSLSAGSSLEIVRYPSQFEILITLRTDVENMIYPPLVTLTYESRLQENALSTVQQVAFKVTYTSSLDRFWDIWEVLIIMNFVFAFFFMCLRVTAYIRRRQNNQIDFALMVRSIIEICGCVSFTLYAVLFIVSAYWFIFFKLQQDVYTMLPTDDDMEPFQTMLLLSIVGQVIFFIHMVWKQTRHDVFFIDWEKPKYTLTPSGRKELSPVSVWRTIFMANEWVELQTRRVTCVELTIILTVCLLEGTSLQNISLITPATGDNSPKPYYSDDSQILRFFIASVLMLAIAAIQYVFQKLILYRYVAHPLGQYTDLLSLANVSVIFLQEQFAGYYIHGRSLMPSADTGMLDFVNELKKEEELSVSARGLMPASDRAEIAQNQVFEIYINTELRNKYTNLLLRHIDEEYLKIRARNGIMKTTLGSSGNVLPQEKMVQAQHDIRNIFRNFINQIEQQPEGHIKEKGYMQRLLDLPPDMTQIPNPLFFHDFSFGFGNFIYHGIELSHILFDTIMFCAIDYAVKNYVLAGMITYAIGRILKGMRAFLARQNIARKSLIDYRFLV